MLKEKIESLGVGLTIKNSIQNYDMQEVKFIGHL